MELTSGPATRHQHFHLLYSYSTQHFVQLPSCPIAKLKGVHIPFIPNHLSQHLRRHSAAPSHDRGVDGSPTCFPRAHPIDKTGCTAFQVQSLGKLRRCALVMLVSELARVGLMGRRREDLILSYSRVNGSR